MPQVDPQAGLCASCVHVRTVASGRGSVFLMCNRALTDHRFQKYPRLPVLRCRGFEAHPDAREGADPGDDARA